jgi:hypothetical protein
MIILILSSQVFHLRWYLTLQGGNSLKSVERFDHMMFVCRFQTSRWSKPQREKLICGCEFIALSPLVEICLNFDIYCSGYIQTHCQKNKKIKWADQILPEVYGTTLISINSAEIYYKLTQFLLVSYVSKCQFF